MFEWMTGNPEIVPVVMFHSVGLEDTDWTFSHISEPLSSFEDKVACLAKAHYNFILWPDLYAFMSGTKKIHLPAVMLTFDDGYLDNWVYVYPILKKYDAKATIFANPDFVDPCGEIRSNMEDVWEGRIDHDDLFLRGFLNWEEMRMMEESGFVDIQSHALTHTWYFSSPRVIDFHKPGDKRYPWMAWNQRPDQKPFYLNDDQSEYVPYGTSVYEHEKALTCKRYFPPEQVAEEITMHVSQRGGKGYFHEKDWQQKLRQIHDELMKKYESSQRYETDDDYRKRVRQELNDSKRIIEKNLNKRIEFICWPGGAYNQDVLALAKEVGYKAWTLGSQDQSFYRNIPGADQIQIKRMGSATRQVFMGKRLGYTTGSEFLSVLKTHQDSLFHKYLGRGKKVSKLIKTILRSNK